MQLKKMMALAVAVVFAAAMPCIADTETVGGYEWTYRINGDTAEISNLWSPAVSPTPVGSLEIPSVLGGKPVAKIGDCAFQSCAALRHVTIPSGLEDIGSYAFNGCGLVDVDIPQGVTNIAASAFSACYSLTNVTIPVSVNHIGAYAFDLGDDAIIPGFKVLDGWIIAQNWDGTSELDLTRFRGVADNVLENVSGLESITLTKRECSRRLGEVLPKCFYALTEVVVALEVTDLAENFFVGCESLRHVYLPKALEGKVGTAMFSGCPADLSVAYYDRMCTVSFDAAGGSAEFPSRSMPNGHLIGILPEPEREGYDFLGWFTAAEGGEQVTAETIVSTDTICYAHWQIKTYTVSFEGVAVTREHGMPLGDVPVPAERVGYDFLRWYGFDQEWRELTATPDMVVTSDMTFYAQWQERMRIQVWFNWNGGSDWRELYQGERLGELPTPTLDGKVFLGWFTAAEGGEQVTADTIAVDYATYYAHWKIRSYVITFDASDSGYVADSVSVEREHGAALGELPAPAERAGFAFRGWFTAAEGGEQVTAETIVSTDTTYYAHWLQYSGMMDADFIRQQTIVGGLQDVASGKVIGTIRLTFGKGSKKGIATVETSVVLSGGQNVYGKPWKLFVGGELSETLYLGDPIGAMYFSMRVDGLFTLVNDAYRMVPLGADWTGPVPPADQHPGDDSEEEGEVRPVREPPTGEETAGELDSALERAQTISGALYAMEDGALMGMVQLKVGALKNQKVKVSASAMLMSGKKATAKSVSVELGEDGTLSSVLTFKDPVGPMAFEMDAGGTFTLENDKYIMEAAKIGDVFDASELTFNVDIDEEPDFGDGWELLGDALPEDVPIHVQGGTKWKCDKAASIKYKRFREDGETWYELVGLGDESKPNLSGLKLSYAPKTGMFKGSFKIYATNESITPDGRSPKLKKYTVNVVGFVVDGVGIGEARCKKPAAGPWTVTVE